MAKPWSSKSHLLIEKVSSTTFIIIPQIHSDLNVSGRGTKVFFSKNRSAGSLESGHADNVLPSFDALVYILGPWQHSLFLGSPYLCFL